MSSLYPHFVKPYNDESFDGYLCRAAADLGYSSPSWLLTEVGIKDSRNCSDKDISGFAQYYGLDQTQLLRMYHYGSVTGARWRGNFFRFKEHYVCPQCMKDAVYLRQSWCHVLCTACSSHGVQLVPLNNYGANLGLGTNLSLFMFFESSLGESPVSGMAASVGQIELAKMLADANKAAEVFSLITVDGKLPEDFSNFLMLLSELKSGRTYNKNKNIGFDQAIQVASDITELLLDFENSFDKNVIDRINSANARVSGGFIPALGGWYKRLHRDFTSAPYDQLRDRVSRKLVAHAEAPLNRKLKQIGSALLEEKKSLTGSEAARMLNSSLDKIVAMVKSGDLKGRIVETSANEFCMVSRVEVDRLRQESEKFLDGNQVMDLLGIPKRLKDRLVECEILVPVSNESRSKFSRGKFKRESVLQLIENLESYYQPKKFLSGSTMCSISRRRLNKSISEDIYTAIFSGEIQCVHIDQSKQGMDRYIFDDADIDLIVDRSGRKVEMSVADMLDLFGYKHAEVKGWINGGLLKARSESHGEHARYYISLPEFNEFKSRHIVLSKAARDMGKLPAHLANSLRARGLLTEIELPEGDGRRGFLIDVQKLLLYALAH